MCPAASQSVISTCWLLLHLQTAGCKQRLSPHCKTQLGSAPCLRDLLTTSLKGGGGRSAANCHNHINRSLKPSWLSKREEKWRIWSFLYHLSFILHHQTETCSKLEGESKESHREKKEREHGNFLRNIHNFVSSQSHTVRVFLFI